MSRSLSTYPPCTFTHPCMFTLSDVDLTRMARRPLTGRGIFWAPTTPRSRWQKPRRQKLLLHLLDSLGHPMHSYRIWYGNQRWGRDTVLECVVFISVLANRRIHASVYIASHFTLKHKENSSFSQCAVSPHT